MCGIAGVFGESDPSAVRLMTRALAHRGPDHQGIYAGRQAVLGNRRLAVIDPQHGNQPVRNEDGRLHLVFNGEIYNHPQLLIELQARGHRLASRCDTEAIVHLYEEQQSCTPCRLRGDFAFAVWDEKRSSGFLARDRMGVKPLYFAPIGRKLAFASELTALLCHPDIGFEVEPIALDLYLSSLAVPAPWTICRNVFKLPPGCSLQYDAASGEYRIERYWRLSPEVGQASDLSNQDLRQRALELLSESVRMQLVSDVPLGVFLSGGIDSSAIVALMRRHSAGTVRTFSIGYPEAFSAFNELEFSRLVARHFQTEHHELVVQPDIEETIHAVIEAMDEPLGDSSAIPTYLVSRETRRHVTVALSGVGGDEVFAGYPRHLGLAWQSLYQRFPRPLRRAAARLAPRIPEQESSRNLGSWVKRFLQSADKDPIEQYRCWMRFFSPQQRRRLFSPSMSRQLQVEDADERLFRKRLAGIGHRQPLDQALYSDLTGYLTDDLLVLADRMSMAHSLEVRVPFCDYRLVEEMMQQSWQRKMGYFSLKQLLKRSLREELPAAVLKRRKQGFMIPVGAWMKRELRPLFEDCFSSGRLKRQGAFDPSAVRSLFEAHLSGSQRWTHQLWGLLVFQLWCEKVDRLKHRCPAPVQEEAALTA